MANGGSSLEAAMSDQHEGGEKTDAKGKRAKDLKKTPKDPRKAIVESLLELGVEGVYDWTRRDPVAAAAINRLTVNSMRFMLEAAAIDTEGPVGAIKLQG